VRIEAVAKSGGLSLSGKPEVWVQVFANEMHDWPSVEAKLSEAQRAELDALGDKRTMRYFPHSPSAEEREEHGYSFEDHWVWAAAK
jgi:hypothetical protein